LQLCPDRLCRDRRLPSNTLFVVRLDRDHSEAEHRPHSSWGLYRVINRDTGKEIFSSANRDKAIGVWEYASAQA